MMLSFIHRSRHQNLGILVDTKLSFAEEIGCRVKKANSIVGINYQKKLHVPACMDDHTFALPKAAKP
jgi:hypothetical protein